MLDALRFRALFRSGCAQPCDCGLCNYPGPGKITRQDQIAKLKTRVVLVGLANIERMKVMYAPELSRLPEPPRDQLLVALAALTSFESWDQMRDCHGLSVEAAQAVWRSAIDRMLPSAG